MHSSLLRLAAASGLLLATSISPAAQLVADINSQPVVTGTPAAGFVQLGSVTLFLMDDGVHGQELWSTDGTAAGTALVKDIRPGPAASNIEALTVVAGVAYFLANDGTNGEELWRSDGTAAGTHIVADVNAGHGDGVYPLVPGPGLVVVGGILYFPGNDAAAGTELWRSDGTAAGTYRVADVRPGAGSSGLAQLVVVGSRLFFTADDGTSGSELWTSDGTTAGTHRVADLNPGSGGSNPQSLTATSAGVFFTADDGTHGRELFFASSDGSGAHLVADLTAGSMYTSFSPLAAFGADVVFGALIDGGANSGGNLYRASSTGVTLLATGLPLNSNLMPQAGFVPYGGRLLFEGQQSLESSGGVWVTDGTAVGTTQLAASRGLLATSLISAGQPAGVYSLQGSDGIYFFGSTGGPGSEIDLWRTDGTEAGTQVYATLPQPFNSSSLAQFQSKIWLAAGRFSATGSELWSTDGTSAGTKQFADLNPGSADSAPDGLVVAGSRLYFIAATATGDGPWATDGTVAGTVALYPAGTPLHTADSQPNSFATLGNRVVFFADDGIHGREPWVTDGTPGGTQLLADVNPGSAASNGSYLGQLGSLELFFDNDGTHGTELWATDGTPAGTRLVSDINPGAADSSPLGFSAGPIVLNGYFYFSADDGIHGRQLWRSDGTSAGTTLVVDLSPGELTLMGNAQLLGGRILFCVYQAGYSYWWSTDGTAAGTQQVSNAVFVSSSTSATLGGYVYFGGQPSAPGALSTHGNLWRTDGTGGGTQLVVDPTPGASNSSVDGLLTLGQRVLYGYCRNSAAFNGCTAFATDGTAAGTDEISPDVIPTGAISSALLGNQLVYVTAYTAMTLRITDGTAAGTRDLLSVPISSGDNFVSPASVAGYVVFSRNDPVLGPSVWRTDGTSTGTTLVAQVSPGGSSQYGPWGYPVLGSQVLFAGYSPATGAELFSLPLAAPNAGDDVANTASGQAVQIPVLANDGALGAPIDLTSVRITTPPGAGAATVDTASGVVTYTPTAGFSGSDVFAYTVADTRGAVSSPATVWVVVAAPDGAAPGTAPPPPPPPPPTAGAGGGGGAMDATTLALLAIFLARRRSTRGAPPGVAPCDPSAGHKSEISSRLITL